MAPGVFEGDAANFSAVVAPEPQDEDVVLVLKQEWLDKILSGEKTMELRPCRLQSGVYYLGSKGTIQAQALLGKAIPIETSAKMKSLRKKHCAGDALPYKSTFGF